MWFGASDTINNMKASIKVNTQNNQKVCTCVCVCVCVCLLIMRACMHAFMH